MMLCRALIKTHHMTSRKKISSIIKAAKKCNCAVYLKSGMHPPGVMIAECDNENLKEWIKNVKVFTLLPISTSRDRTYVPLLCKRIRRVDKLLMWAFYVIATQIQRLPASLLGHRGARSTARQQRWCKGILLDESVGSWFGRMRDLGLVEFSDGIYERRMNSVRSYFFAQVLAFRAIKMRMLGDGQQISHTTLSLHFILVNSA